MVDFNNEATVGIPAVDVEKISILQRRYDFIEAFELYKKTQFNGAHGQLSICRARILSLFLELQACLKRRASQKRKRSSFDYESIKKTILNKQSSEEEILNTFFEINEVLDDMHITRVDTQTAYNAGRVEEENKIKGY